MSYDLSSVRFCVVEDSRHMRSLVCRVLASFGVQDVVEVSDGNAALMELQTWMPDIVITDFAMAPIDGIELTRHIRNPDECSNPYLPIIMMTGYTEMHRVIEARDAGVTEIIAKPVSAMALYGRLVSVIDRPRPFVRAAGFFGPDRRRRQIDFKGPERRNSGNEIEI
ncbi:MAG: response regulator [Alphaproteobacteria bacterium]